MVGGKGERAKHFKCLILGRSGSGKTVILKEVLSHLAGKVDMTMCFSPTQSSCDLFRKHVPSSCVFQGGFRLDLLARAMEVQRSLAPANKQRQMLIVCDDCAYDKSALRGDKGATLHDYAYNGRHQSISLLYCAQHVYDLPPDVRSQMTHCICTANNQHQEKRKLWQAFGGVCSTYREFDALFTAATATHGVLVLDSSDPGASLDRSAFWFRAELGHKPFSLAKPVFYKLEEQQRKKDKPEAILVQEKPRRLVDAI